MKYEDMIKKLPNGFHDSEIENLNVDYLRMELVLLMNVLVGEPSSEDRLTAEKYRRANIVFSELQFCAIEPPDVRYSYQGPGPLMIDSGPLPCDNIPNSKQLSESVPQDAFAFWIYVNRWNAFLQIAAKDVSITWLT